MKKFKTKKRLKKRIEIYIVLIIIIVLSLLHYYDNKISDKILDLTLAKLEQITTIYIKKDIAPKNVELNDLIKINLNSNQEIIYVDIDTDYARELMIETVGKIQNNIYKLEQGDFGVDKNMNELRINDNHIYLLLPLMLANDGVLMQSLGPKIPIKVSFFEYVFGNIDTEVIEYGINNALIKISLTISLEQKIIIPYKEQKKIREYSIILGSKIIPGKVPSIYGGTMKNSSPILEI